MSGMADEHAAQAGPQPLYQLLHELPRGHELRISQMGGLGAQCRNLLGKEWRDLSRWRIASSTYDELGESWTSTSEFRVPAR